MNDKRPKVTADVQRLIDMEDEVVYAKDLAPIVHIKPDVIIRYAKTGKWNLCRFVISGGHVKFFRKDFLQKCGFVDPEPEEKSTEKMILEQLIALNEGISMICQMLTLMMEPYQLDALNELISQKEAERCET